MSARVLAGVIFASVWAADVLAAAAATGSAAASGNGTGAAAGGRQRPPPSPEKIRAELLTAGFSKLLVITLGVIGCLLLLYRIISVIYAQIRLLATLNTKNQRYFASPSGEIIPWLKKHVLYAPMFRVRHNREFQLSTAINMGTLPTRFQTLFLVGYVATNIAFCTHSLDYSDRQKMLSGLRNRAGVMAIINMGPLFLLAGRNNPLIGLLGISFDSFNLVHRWLGRIVVLEALTHVISWMVGAVLKSGWEVVRVSITTVPFAMYGFMAAVALTFLILHSPSAIRHAFYETFLFFHIMAAAVVCAGLYYHIAYIESARIWLTFVKVPIIGWGFERSLRLLSLIKGNVGKKMTTAHVEALPGDAVRVTVRMARPWKFRPGQHLYLYMPKLGLWTSHPFTISWSEDKQRVALDDEKLSLHRQDIYQTDRTMSLIVRRRTGFTDILFKKAFESPEKSFTTIAFAEGPYGNIDFLGSYGTVVLIAGGVGITHPVSYLRELVAGYANGVVATRRITLVWVIQSPEHLEWIRPWMTEILAMEKRREVLKVLLFVTRPKSTKEIHSPSATVQMFPGRPNFDTLINMEIEAQMGSMAVAVCGGGSLSDDVRRVVRSKQNVANIDFMEAAFSW